MVADDWFKVGKGHYRAERAELKQDGPDDEWSLYVKPDDELMLLAVGNFYEQFLLNALEFGEGSFVAVQTDVESSHAELLLCVGLVCLLLWVFGIVWTMRCSLISYSLFFAWQGQLAKPAIVLYCAWAGTDRPNKIQQA